MKCKMEEHRGEEEDQSELWGSIRYPQYSEIDLFIEKCYNLRKTDAGGRTLLGTAGENMKHSNNHSKQMFLFRPGGWLLKVGC